MLKKKKKKILFTLCNKVPFYLHHAWLDRKVLAFLKNKNHYGGLTSGFWTYADNHLLYADMWMVLVIIVNGKAWHQLAQCECSTSSCGYRVGCCLVSVPRTAALSNLLCPPLDPWKCFLFFRVKSCTCTQHTLLDASISAEKTLQKQSLHKEQDTFCLVFVLTTTWGNQGMAGCILSNFSQWLAKDNDLNNSHKRSVNTRGFYVIFIIIGQLGTGKKLFCCTHSSLQETDPWRWTENQTQVKHSPSYT